MAGTLISKFGSPFRALLPFLTLAFALVALIAPQGLQAAGAGDLDRAAAAIRGISTMKANFQQTDRTGQTVSGVLTLKRPGKLRFQYEDSVNMLIVSNGSTLTMVDYDVRQVQRWPIKNSPLGALLNPERDITRYGEVVPTGSPNVVSIRVRDPKKPEYGMITLILVRDASAPGGLELASWVALDSQNKRTTVRLTNHRYGIEVPNRMFNFDDPRKTGRR